MEASTVQVEAMIKDQSQPVVVSQTHKAIPGLPDAEFRMAKTRCKNISGKAYYESKCSNHVYSPESLSRRSLIRRANTKRNSLLCVDLKDTYNHT
jgi:hypothetical protein